MTTAVRRPVLLAYLVALSALFAVRTPVEASTLATLELSADRAMPGQELSFEGWYYNDTHPVIIRWDSLDGPVLATVTPDTFGVVHNHFRSIAGTLRIPPDAEPGAHLLVATQDFAPPGKITWGVPARTRIHVGPGDAPVELQTLDRPTAVAAGDTPGVGPLLAAGAFGALFAAALVGTTLLLRRRAKPS